MEIQGTAENLTFGGTIEGIELESHQTVYIRENKIAAVMRLGDGGPTRLFFTGGGSIDVCGGAEIWAINLRIAEIQDSSPSGQKTGLAELTRPAPSIPGF